MYASAICEALNQRRLLRFRYKDHATLSTVEPYTFGANKKGNDALSAWLVSGTTHDDRPPFWRLYLVSEMTQIEVLAEDFASNRDGYNPSDTRFQVIRCRVGPER